MSIFNKIGSKFLIFIDHVVVKIISLIFDMYLFYCSHFIWLIICYSISIIIYRNIFFITIFVFIVKKISTDPNADYISNYVIFLYQILMNIFNITSRNSIIIYTKIIFILSTDQSFDIFPKHNGVATISESFALNLQSSVPFKNK